MSLYGYPNNHLLFNCFNLDAAAKWTRIASNHTKESFILVLGRGKNTILSKKHVLSGSSWEMEIGK